MQHTSNSSLVSLHQMDYCWRCGQKFKKTRYWMTRSRYEHDRLCLARAKASDLKHRAER
jgi:hypothetical protein